MKSLVELCDPIRGLADDIDISRNPSTARPLDLMSGFLLDTNIPSEVAGSSPQPSRASWVNGQDNSTLCLSAIRRGFTLLPIGEGRTRLERWFGTDVLSWLGDRICRSPLRVAAVAASLLSSLIFDNPLLGG